MSILTTQIGSIVTSGTSEWEVAGPISEFAPQVIAVIGEQHATDAIQEGSGSTYLVAVPADQINNLIDALTQVRDTMKEKA